ncbi:MAG: hypothetical protein O6914_02600 [Chloroflexi bacterium]|nr:hypothetical protein [Chloroflexota bacterium]
MRKLLLYMTLALVVLTAGQGGYALSQLDATVAPYRWGLVEWEVSHFLNKWRYRIREAMPWHNPPAKEEGLLEAFFRLNQEINDMERELVVVRDDGSKSEAEAAEAKEEVEKLQKQRSRLKPQVEERLEGEISNILAKEGFESRIGLIWPPVDVELVTPPSVLVISPRDVIARQRDIKLRPGLEVEDRESLEDEIFQEQDMSALVVNIGGIATYPSIVTTNSGLRHALVTTAHEWLHQYWFFRPLGWNYWRDSNTTTLNESAANLAGRELGERAYEAITGEKIERPQELEEPRDTPEDEFDFREEMRKTRLRTDALLAEGKVEEAERYMEERRQVFLDNGFFIRKLNQAYFAFFGTYADNPASVSPINEELKRFRATVATVGDFVTEMSGFGSYEEFKEHLTALEAARGASTEGSP